MGVGWVSRRPLATWEVLARELGHSLGASDFLDETKCVCYLFDEAVLVSGSVARKVAAARSFRRVGGGETTFMSET